MDFGVDVWWPLADFATSRGRGAGTLAFPEAVFVDGASTISPAPHVAWIAKLPLSPFPL